MIVFDFDKIGFCASSLCAVHCMGTPIILFFSSSAGFFMVFDHPLVEHIMLGSAVVVGILSFVPSFIKHRRLHVIILFVSGVFLLVNAEFATVDWSAVALSVVGGLLMAYAHYENFKLKTTSI